MAKFDMEMLDEIDKLIIDTLKKHKKLTTYQLAKQTKLSWSTVNSHCYKLKSMDAVDGKMEPARVGSRKKVIWWAK